LRLAPTGFHVLKICAARWNFCELSFGSRPLVCQRACSPAFSARAFFVGAARKVARWNYKKCILNHRTLFWQGPKYLPCRLGKRNFRFVQVVGCPSCKICVKGLAPKAAVSSGGSLATATSAVLSQPTLGLPQWCSICIPEKSLL
jgi:hypothetical protein